MRAKLLILLTFGAVLAGLYAAPASISATKGPTVTSALKALRASNSITAGAYQQYSSGYLTAQRSLKKLTGTRHGELAGVLTNVQAIAASGGFIASRLPALFLTLERNQQWWTTKGLLSYGQRVSFPGSRLVWESYPGQGIEIQWLGTFGEANGYYLSGNQNTALKELLAEVLPLATQRAGGIAWEYMFQFDGGLPPWTSGLSQGTALQAFSRAWSRFKEPADLTAAQQALGIFKTPPPAGVRVTTAAGAHYLEYTYAPSERILNGYIQAIIGLYDYASLTKDPLGEQLFQAGDAEARLEVPHYDTGAWSMYDQHEESDLGYHELLTEFLVNLCKRTQQGPPIATTAPAPATQTGTTTTSAPVTPPPPSQPENPSTGGSPTGGATAARVARVSSARAIGAAASKSPPPNPIAGDGIYCTAAEHFTADLHTPPVIALLSHRLSGGTRAGVQMSLSKISTVSLTVRQGTQVVWTNKASVEGGKPKLLWSTPTKGGSYSVTLRAVDLAGNSASTTGTITVTTAHRASPTVKPSK